MAIYGLAYVSISEMRDSSATHKLVPIEITDSWNKLIDDMIESKRRDFEGEVKRLKEKKDETKTKSVLDMV